MLIDGGISCSLYFSPLCSLGKCSRNARLRRARSKRWPVVVRSRCIGKILTRKVEGKVRNVELVFSKRRSQVGDLLVGKVSSVSRSTKLKHETGRRAISRTRINKNVHGEFRVGYKCLIRTHGNALSLHGNDRCGSSPQQNYPRLRFYS